MPFKTSKKRLVAKKNILIHLDDLGATKKISIEQIELIKSCKIASGSLLMNGSGIGLFEREINQLKNLQETPDLFVHLNIVEGKPLTRFTSDNLNCIKNGMFNLNHIKIFQILYFSSAKRTNSFLEMVESEWDAQIKEAIIRFGRDSVIGLDSHRHTHGYKKLNTVANILMEKYQISYLRPTHEKYFMSKYSDLVRFPFLLGLLRNLYLKIISQGVTPGNEVGPITGIIYSGFMTEKSALDGTLANMPQNLIGLEGTFVLSIFHPGCATLEEVADIPKQFKKWYTSENRQREFDAVLSLNQIGEKLT
jgi:predicted glycoside hydrolase/deacetylase ChbG (UPF0249 family)